MNTQEIERLVINAIQEVAPEIERCDLNDDEDLRELCDLDSMDFLNCLIALKKSTGISIPEKDYQQIATFSNLIAYLDGQINQ